VLGLMSSREGHSDSVRRGIGFLLRTQQTDGFWSDPDFNAPGFPRVFYLKYHGYDKYFPLLALARYRSLLSNLPASDQESTVGRVMESAGTRT
jgi:squalene-hopene/tetraprenyl-beta-curcumene cyclase